MKILLLDADGVTLKKREYFSERISRENNVSLAEIEPFYKNEFRLCQQGRADLKKELSKYLFRWKWNGTVDEFLNYWFTADTETDEAIFKEIERIRKKGIKCYLASDQEKYRAQYIREKLDFNSKLDGCFFSYEFGFQKFQSDYFIQVIYKLNIEPAEITYFDDDQKNVAAAASLGIDAQLYSEINDLKSIH